MTFVVSKACRFLKIFGRNYLSQTRSTSYYVLIPEVPPDTEETNTLLRYKETPTFPDITPESIVSGCTKLALLYEAGITIHKYSLQEKEEKKELTFENVYEPMEKLSVPLLYGLRVARHLFYLSNSTQITTAFRRVMNVVQKARHEQWNDGYLYSAMKDVYSDTSCLSPVQARVLELNLLEGKFAGALLEESVLEDYKRLSAKLNTEYNLFRARVQAVQSMFCMTVEDYSLVRNIPRKLRAFMADSESAADIGPWKVTLQASVYSSFMEHCSDRTLRWNTWHAYVARAGYNFRSQTLSNEKPIVDILGLRRLVATTLGYKNYVEFALDSKMAQSIDNVVNMIESLREGLKPCAEHEFGELRKFAVSKGLESTLEPYDIPYYQRWMKDELASDNEKLTSLTQYYEYFPFEHVLQRMFHVFSELFDIRIQEVEQKKNLLDVDTRYFEVFDANESAEPLGSFFMDPYARSSKMDGCWMDFLRDGSQICGTRPLSSFVLNVDKADNPAMSTVSFSQLCQMFGQFGFGMKQLLSSPEATPYSAVFGQNAVEVDANSLVFFVMKRLVFLPSVLKSLSKHVVTGESLTEEQTGKLLTAERFMRAHDTMLELYYSALDLELHLSKETWKDIVPRVWTEFMPYPLHREDEHLCSFIPLFADSFAASYYANKWADMLGADIFSSFVEHGSDSLCDLKPAALRFRKTFLSMGGSLPAEEMFRLFRGRDPLPDSLISEFLSQS